MDSTELHYISYDPDAVWQKAMDAYIAAGGDVLYPGDEKEMLLRGVQAFMIQELANADNGLRMMTVRYAQDEFLDIVGENQKRGCKRIAAKAASGSVKISFKESGVAQTIAAGMQMTADGQKYYKTTADIYQTGQEQEVIAAIECVEAGAAGNGLAAGTQMQLAISNKAIVQIVVTDATSGGNDTEGNEPYRERMRNYGMANATTGPAQRYRSDAMAVSSEIIDAEPMQISAGVVGIYLLLADGADADGIIENVHAALSPDATRPLTDDVQVMQAEEIGYTLNISYALAETATAAVLQAVTEAAEAYTQWQDFKIGRAFNPDWLVSKMYTAGATRVTIAEGSSFNGGAAEYTEVEKNVRLRGEITLMQAT